jgi:hypothetical protein
MDDAIVVEEEDDGEGEEDDAEANAGSHAALLGGGREATLLRRIRVTAGPGGIGRFGQGGLR